MFRKAQADVLRCLIFPQRKDIQFTLIVEERNQKMLTFKELESDDLNFS